MTVRRRRGVVRGRAAHPGLARLVRRRDHGLGVAAIAQGMPARSRSAKTWCAAAALATVDGSLAAQLVCLRSGPVAGRADIPGAVVLLTAAEPATRCTAAYLFDEARRLQVVVRFAGSTSGAAVLSSCWTWTSSAARPAGSCSARRQRRGHAAHAAGLPRPDEVHGAAPVDPGVGGPR